MKSLRVCDRQRRRGLFSLSLLLLLVSAGCDSVQVDAPELTPPLLQTPRDAQIVAVGSTVTFKWQSVEGARRYECEVRYADDEGKNVRAGFTDQTTATLTFDEPGQYSWRVRARNARDAAGVWSEAWELTILAQTDP